MTTELESLEVGDVVYECCPGCEVPTRWYRPLGAIKIRCTKCGFTIDFNRGPPKILCSGCGELYRSGTDDKAFHCKGCSRRVTA